MTLTTAQKKILAKLAFLWWAFSLCMGVCLVATSAVSGEAVGVAWLFILTSGLGAAVLAVVIVNDTLEAIRYW